MTPKSSLLLTLILRSLLLSLLVIGYPFFAPAAQARPAKTPVPVSEPEDDEATDNGTSDGSAGDSLEILHHTEVVYAASKSEEKTTEAPGSTTILTSSEIKAGGFRSLDDLLNYVRGFYVNYDRDYSYVGLRGFGSLGGYNSRLLLLVDGQRLNDNVYGQFYSGQDTMIDMDAIDHVEIIRGPASVLFGSNAVFGVIDIVTKKGKDAKGLSLTARGGSLGTFGGGILWGGQGNDGFQWTAQGSAFNSDGNAALYFPEYDDPSTNNGLAEHCDGENAQHAFLSMGKDDWNFETAFMHRSKTVPTGVYGTVFNDPRTNTDDVDLFAELNFHHGDPESGEWMGRAYLDVVDYWGRYLTDPSGTINVDVGFGSWWGAELRYTFEPFSQHKVTLGGVFVDNFQQYQSNYDIGISPPYLDDQRQSIEVAGYLQDEVRLSSGIFLDAGIRYDHFSTTGGQFVPRGALIFEPASSSVLKLVAGRAFRAPGPFELYYQDNGSSQEPNPDLANETFDTFEADWEQSFLTDHRFLLSLYRYTGRDLILGTMDPNNGLLVYENIGQISINGLEAEYQFHNAGGIQGRLSLALQRAQDDLVGEVLPDSPQVLGKASLQVPIDARHLTVSGECQFTGASYGFTGAWAPDYTLFNLKFYSPHFLWDDLEANLAFYNLFDTRYWEPVSNAMRELTLQQDGLVVWARLSYRP